MRRGPTLVLGAALAVLLATKAAAEGGRTERLMVGRGDSQGSAVVFIYHRFGEDRYPSTSVRLEQFEEHLDYLEDHDYTVWPVERVIQELRSGGQIPERTVSITVDDAYASVYDEAYPRLKERGWPLTVFVATEPVDSGRGAYMSWQQMREMQASGLVSFSNHSRSHDHLARRDAEAETPASWAQRVIEDIDQAQQRLQDELGEGVNTDPKLFAYPYGEYSASLAEILTEKGYIAFGQHSGALGPTSDIRSLPRFPINEQYAERDKFTRRARSLPLPVLRLDPFQPILQSGANPPRMVVQLADDEHIATDRLACYASGQGAAQVAWLDEGHTRFAVEAQEAFGKGRARYNCTAPHTEQTGRFFWLSKQWLRF